MEGHKDSVFGCAYFRAVCPKGHKVVRYITEKDKDPYYRKSEKVQKELRKMKRDLIQPGEDGFKTYYSEQWKKIESASEEWERKQEEKRKQIENDYMKLKEVNKKVADTYLRYAES